MTMLRSNRLLAAILGIIALAAGVAIAQDGAERSRFVRTLENMISTPDRRIEITGLEGAFSSNPTVEKLTVSDRQGPWLEAEGVAAVWSRMALLRRRLDIQTITAQRITVLRRPLPAEQQGEPRQGGSRALPVDVTVSAFNVPEIVLAQPVAGVEARLSAEGSAQVTADVAAVRLSVERLDRPGTLSADLRLQPASNVLTAELKLSEPEGGLLADLLRLRGRPAVDIALDGEGPLADWRANLEMQAAGARVLAGGATVTRVDAGYRITADLAGTLQNVVPEDYAALLAGDSRLALDVTRAGDGAINLESASLSSGGVELQASGTLTADFVPSAAELSLRLGQAGRTTLPFVPGGVSVAQLDASIGLTGGTTSPWRIDATAAGVESAFGAVGELSLMASGEARNLASPAQRATTFQLGGSASNVQAADPAVAAALGSMARIMASGSWSAGMPVGFNNLETVLAGATAGFSGTASATGLDGRFTVSATDLGRFADLVKRPIAGMAQLQATGTVARTGDFDLKLDGETTDLTLGIGQLDPLLAGATRISGGAARAQGAFRFDELAVSNARANATVSGSFADPAIDLTLTAGVTELASLTPRASGAASMTARVTGTRTAPQIEAEASGEQVVLMDRALTGASARFSGVVGGPQTAGDAEIAGMLDGVPVRGAARLAAGENGARRLEDLLFGVGESRASGELTMGADNLLTGALNVVSPDLSKVAPLFLVNASGALNADITLTAENGGQSATLSGTATNLVYENVTLQSAEVSGQARDLFRQPQLQGQFSLRNLRTGGLQVVTATGNATQQGQSTGFSVDATLSDGSARLQGSLSPQGQGFAIALQNLAYTRSGLGINLAAPTTIVVQQGTARFDRTRLNVGGGSVTIAGQAGASLNLTADLSNVPAAAVNNLAPRLGAEGTVNGSVTVTGRAAAPAARFTADWRGASVAAARNAGLGPLAITAEGNLANRTLTLSSRITGADALSLQVTGTVGTAAGAPLNLRIQGGVPLSLGNPRLASRGAVLRGGLNVDMAITGPARAPQFAGRVTSEGGSFIDPATGIVLRDLSLAASISNNRLVIDRLTARSGEGTARASGSVGLAPGSGFPLDLRAQVRQARYVDGALVTTRFDADVTLTGTLAAGPLLRGSVHLDRTEITVPEQLPPNSVAVDVKHVDPSPDVRRTFELARDGSGGRERGGGGSAMRLDVTIDAPRQIFVRGRGLDAELGGRLRVTGPVSAIVADGAFQMRRGRLDLLTQRITFDRGIITFAGDLDPILDFSGSTSSSSITVTVTVAGPASDPQIQFSSVPELPQDEVLAHLIFNKGITDLSPVQIARLASVAGGGVLDQLRRSTGLDDLDIVTDDQGDAALAAGRYISENVYVGVQQGATSESTRVTIDLDITRDLKARAAVSPNGSSSVGLFYEREY